jgi:Mn2+/Fe2+ NRAMP family transporter
MEVEGDLRAIPKRRLSEAEKQIITLRIEKMRLEREKSVLILGSGIILFFAFIIIAIIGLLNELITRNQLNLLILVGFLALIIGVIPYIRFVIKEEKSMEKTLEELIG